jgi:hypothetical protein
VSEGLRAHPERGQATAEWIGLLALVSVVLVAALATVGRSSPAAGFARAIVTRLLCAADLSGGCSSEGALVAAYGAEVAAVMSEHVPRIVYEQGMTALPVDFRSCRWSPCGNGPDSGPVWRSDTGQPAVAFVHVVDCRSAEAQADGATHGYECSGARDGNLYLQYWLYYEDSTSLRDLPGDVGSHQDDWEGYQLRIGPAGIDARATSHHGYNHRGGPGSWLSDAGIVHRSGWGPSHGRLYVSGGSHAGHVHEDGGGAPARWTPSGHLELIPIEGLGRRSRRAGFAVTPPWRKPVYFDPEDERT